VYVGAAGIGALADVLTDGLATVALAAVIGGMTYDLLNVCSSPDPGDPVLTHDDLLNALEPQNPLAFNAAVARIQQWFVHMMWPLWCNCANGTAPPPSTAINPPPVGTNDGLPSGTATAPCWDTKQSYAYAINTPTTDLTRSLVPYQHTQPADPSVGVPGNIVAVIPSGVTQFTSTVTLDRQPATVSFVVGVDYVGSTGLPTGGVSIGDYNGQTGLVQTGTHVIPTNTTGWAIVSNNADSVAHSFSVEISFFCPGQQPIGVSTPCCPPDPNVDIRLRSIQDMLTYVMNHLGATPNSYTKGTVHASLSGQGNISISGLVGVQAVVRSGTPTVPQLEGNPPYQWNLGWLSASTPDGMIDEKRLTRTNQVWISGLTPFANSIGYYFNPGVVVDLVELQPVG
jgi:hypothetical protein